MNSRCSLWLLCVCCVSLAGCANWQNRAQQNSAPGSAATMNAAPAPAGLNLFAPDASADQSLTVAPGSTSHDMMMPTAGTAATADRLDLGAVPTTPPPPSAPMASAEPVRETSRSAVPDKLYNLESSRSTKKVASASPTSSRKSNTISRLAKKADTPEKTSAPKPESTKSTSADKPSTLERLAREAPTGTREVAEQMPSSLPRPGTAATEPEPVRSTSASSSDTPAAEPPVAEPAPIDTSFLAQPVRKGAGDEDADAVNDSKGPQSRVIPNSSLFNGNTKPVIYPVSNPAVEEQVDVTQFS